MPENRGLITAVPADSAVPAEAIETLRQELTESMSELETSQKQQEALIADVQNRLISQNQKIAQLEVLLINQSKPKPRLQHVRAAKPKPVTHQPQAARVPFILVSIDQWGKDTYAILRHEGQLYEKTRGQTLSGWTLLALDRTTDTVSMKDPAGRLRELAVTVSR